MTDIMKLFKEKAREKRRKMLICEAWDGRPLKAINSLKDDDLMDFVLLDNGDIKKKADELGIDISNYKLIDYKNSELREELAQAMFKLRQHKGMTLEYAKELLDDVNYFGCMMVLQGYADAVCSSCICPTSDIMRPALQLIKTKEGSRTVSEVSAMIDKKNNNRVLFLTDGSVVIAPTPEQRADIVFNAVDIVKGLGIEPKVALLSHSTHGSGEHPVLEPIRETLKICKERDPNLVIDGEMQADAAINPDAAAKKADDLVIKGDANILVFPEIMSGNITGHLLLQLTDNEMYIFVAGMKMPVGVFGRSTSWEHHALTMITTIAQCNM